MYLYEVYVQLSVLIYMQISLTRKKLIIEKMRDGHPRTTRPRYSSISAHPPVHSKLCVLVLVLGGPSAIEIQRSKG